MEPTTATEIKSRREESMRALGQQIRQMQEPYRAYQRALNKRLSFLLRKVARETAQPGDWRAY